MSERDGMGRDSRMKDKKKRKRRLRRGRGDKVESRTETLAGREGHGERDNVEVRGARASREEKGTGCE